MDVLRKEYVVVVQRLDRSSKDLIELLDGF